MSDQQPATAPVETVDADGWVRRTYADGNWTRRRRAEDGMLEIQYSWDPLRDGAPETVRRQDEIALREWAWQAALDRERRILEALRGDSPNR